MAAVRLDARTGTPGSPPTSSTWSSPCWRSSCSNVGVRSPLLAAVAARRPGRHPAGLVRRPPAPRTGGPCSPWASPSPSSSPRSPTASASSSSPCPACSACRWRPGPSAGSRAPRSPCPRRWPWARCSSSTTSSPPSTRAPATSSAGTSPRPWPGSSPSPSASPSASSTSGFLIRGLRTGRGRATTAGLLALCGLCHIIPAFYVLARHRPGPRHLARPGPAAVVPAHRSRWPACSPPSGWCPSPPATPSSTTWAGTRLPHVGGDPAQDNWDYLAPHVAVGAPRAGRRRAGGRHRLPPPARLPAGRPGRALGPRLRPRPRQPAVERPDPAPLLPVDLPARRPGRGRAAAGGGDHPVPRPPPADAVGGRGRRRARRAGRGDLPRGAAGHPAGHRRASTPRARPPSSPAPRSR